MTADDGQAFAGGGGSLRRVAIVQHSPAVLDIAEGLFRARRWIREAAADGAQLVAFPESWLGGYPAWMFDMAGWDDPEAKRWYGTFLENSLEVAGEEFQQLRDAAADAEVTVVMGFNERARAQSGSVFNSLATIGPDGAVLNVHRKLTPTHTERLGWAPGDAHGLRVVETALGRVGGLICWEHWHPLARFALHAQDEQIHVAAWPDTSEMHLMASRTYAFEGRCFVLAAGQYLELADVPDELQAAYDRGVGPVSDDPALCFDGGSAVFGPDGGVIAEAGRGNATILHAEVDLVERDRQSHDLDVAGHYGRDDIFSLQVRNARPRPVEFID